MTDGDHHEVAFVCSGQSHTVTVYEPEEAAMPKRLARLIRELESLWLTVMFPLDATVQGVGEGGGAEFQR